MAAKKKKSPVKSSARAKGKKPAAKPAARKTAPRKGAPRPAAKKRVVRTAKRPTARPKKPAPRPRKKAPALPENPQALALAREIAQVALEKKALDVLIIDTRARASSVGYDYIVLATGESDRQLGAIADGLGEVLKPRGHRPTSVEPAPDWVLVNYDDVVVHLFTPDKRGVYDLEGLWSDAPRVALAS
jgi:ribosome-associated protein